jgi:hypothetical protein
MARTTFNGPVASQNGFLIGRVDGVPDNSPGIYAGPGAPTFTATQGSLFLRTDGSSTSTRMYVNTNGATTWTNVTTAA